MTRRFALVLAIVLSLGAARSTIAAQGAAPDTPAGRVLKAWLEAFNSADSASMETYYQKYEPGKPSDSQIGFRRQTGGFDLVSIEKSEPSHIEFIVKEKKSETRAFGMFDIAAGGTTVKSSGLQAIPKGASSADFKIDAA